MECAPYVQCVWAWQELLTRSDQGVVGIFMYMLMKSDVVQVKGRLDRFRDLIYIDDVVQGWERVLFGQAYNQTFNLGDGVSYILR